MEPVLIPSIPELSHFGHGKMHLILSHLLVNREYRTHYKKERDWGSYIILDNSAHERGAGEKAQELLQQAIEVHAQEIVCPDVLFKCDETVESTEAALRFFVEEVPKTDRQFSLMIVPQGEDIPRWRRCLNELLRLYWSYTQQARSSFPHEVLIGLSKDYSASAGGLVYIVRDHLASLKLPIHLLGWGKTWWELGQIAEHYKCVRSIDSAKPFVAALEGVELKFSMNGEVHPRPDDYFDRVLTPEQRRIAGRNIGLFAMMAAGSDCSWW